MSSDLSAEIIHAAAIVKNGGIVAFPTETFYGLAVDPFNPHALQRLFNLKGRPADKAVLVLIDQSSRCTLLVRNTPGLYESLIKKFWPGPLTLVFDGVAGLPELLTDHQGTVGIRWSANQIACRLAAEAGGVITGTSANPSGKAAATSTEEVKELFPDGVDYILDGGKTPGGKGSTILKLEAGKLVSVREGVIPLNTLGI